MFTYKIKKSNIPIIKHFLYKYEKSFLKIKKELYFFITELDPCWYKNQKINKYP